MFFFLLYHFVVEYEGMKIDEKFCVSKRCLKTLVLNSAPQSLWKFFIFPLKKVFNKFFKFNKARYEAMVFFFFRGYIQHLEKSSTNDNIIPRSQIYWKRSLYIKFERKLTTLGRLKNNTYNISFVFQLGRYISKNLRIIQKY